MDEVALEAKGCWRPFTLDEILAPAPTDGTFGTWKGLGVPEDPGQEEVLGDGAARRPGGRRGRSDPPDGSLARRTPIRRPGVGPGAGSGPRRGHRRGSKRREPGREPSGGPGSAARPPTCARIPTASAPLPHPEN